MHHRHFSGDPRADAGIWAPSTSVANFCEEDYAVTIYIAEFINTLSNLAYVYYAFAYARSRRWDFMAISLFLVGVASLVFHATLHQETQYGDDLSMLVLSASFLIPVWTKGYPLAVRRVISATIILSVAAVAAAYVRTGDIAFHTYSFAAIMTLSWPRTLYLIHFGAPSKGGNVKKGWRRGQVRSLAKAGILVAVGFGLWNVDLERCAELRAIRSKIGLPFAWLFELHGWWHILTAAAAYVYMCVVNDVVQNR